MESKSRDCPRNSSRLCGSTTGMLGEYERERRGPGVSTVQFPAAAVHMADWPRRTQLAQIRRHRPRTRVTFHLQRQDGNCPVHHWEGTAERSGTALRKESSSCRRQRSLRRSRPFSGKRSGIQEAGLADRTTCQELKRQSQGGETRRAGCRGKF